MSGGRGGGFFADGRSAITPGLPPAASRSESSAAAPRPSRSWPAGRGRRGRAGPCTRGRPPRRSHSETISKSRPNGPSWYRRREGGGPSTWASAYGRAPRVGTSTTAPLDRRLCVPVPMAPRGIMIYIIVDTIVAIVWTLKSVSVISAILWLRRHGEEYKERAAQEPRRRDWRERRLALIDAMEASGGGRVPPFGLMTTG